MSGAHISTKPWWEEYRSALAACETHHIELFFRSMAATPGSHDQRVGLVEHVDELVDRGIVDGFEVTLLGSELCLCDTCTGLGASQELLAKIEAVHDWESANARSVGFEERAVDSSITGEAYRLLIPPTTGLQVRVDGKLRGVFPARIDGTHYTPSEFVEAVVDARLRRGQPSGRREAGTSATPL